MVKAIYGVTGVLVVLVCTYLMFGVGLSDAKAGNFQLNATQCVTKKDPESEICEGLVKFGVDPSMYLTDKVYKDKIDSYYRSIIEGNAKKGLSIAQFTLDHAYSKKVVIAADVIKKLKAIAEEQKSQPTQ